MAIADGVVTLEGVGSSAKVVTPDVKVGKAVVHGERQAAGVGGQGWAGLGGQRCEEGSGYLPACPAQAARRLAPDPLCHPPLGAWPAAVIDNVLLPITPGAPAEEAPEPTAAEPVSGAATTLASLAALAGSLLAAVLMM